MGKSRPDLVRNVSRFWAGSFGSIFYVECYHLKFRESYVRVCIYIFMFIICHIFIRSGWKNDGRPRLTKAKGDQQEC